MKRYFITLFVLLAALIVSISIANALTLRCPPLSEWNFSASNSGVNYTITGVQTYDDDLLRTWDRKTASGAITTTVMAGDPAGKALQFFASNSTPDISISAVGNWETYAETSPIIYVRYGALKRLLSIDTSEAGDTLTNTEYLDGTLAKYLTDEIDDLVAGLTASDITKKLFINLNETTGSADGWNPNNWSYSVDKTSMSYWADDDSSQYRWRTIAITSKYVFANHGPPFLNTDYHWLTPDGTVIVRQITSHETIHTGTYIGVLNAPLPVAATETDPGKRITPAKLMPANVDQYLPNREALNIPVIAQDQEEKSWVVYWQYTATGDNADKENFDCWQGCEMCEEVIGGDSNSPIFVQINGETVLVSTWWQLLVAMHILYGPSIHQFLDEINEGIETLEGVGAGEASEYPETVDLSMFPSY